MTTYHWHWLRRDYEHCAQRKDPSEFEALRHVFIEPEAFGRVALGLQSGVLKLAVPDRTPSGDGA